MPEDETPKELQQISDEELKQILEDHLRWVESEGKEGRKADLSYTDLRGKNLKIEGEDTICLEEAHLEGVSLHGAHLQRADLIEAHLEGADLIEVHLEGAHLWSGHLEGADLIEAHLEGTHLRSGHFEKANLWGAHLEGAYLRSGQLEKANLWRAHLQRANLTEANLEGADLMEANLEGAKLRFANFEGTDLFRANLEGADLRDTNLEGADVTGVTYDRTGKYQGVRVATCYGSPMFKRFAQDQDFIEELKSRGNNKDFGWFRRRYWWALYYLWLVMADCGRTPWRWMGWSAGFALLFGTIFFFLGREAFRVAHENQLPWLLNSIYYSVVTFTTLGFGDITPITKTAAFFVMAEVILGYVMLGGLISIFATLLARRSGQ